MIPLPEDTKYGQLPHGTILAWDGVVDGRHRQYFLMENEADLIIAELAGWALYQRFWAEPDTGRVSGWNQLGTEEPA